MAFVANAKAVEIAHELASKISQRLGTALAVVESFDTDGCPVINVGPGTAGSKNVVIKLANVDWALAKDSLGLAAGAYGPEVVMLATEADPTGGVGADPLDPATILAVFGDSLRTGCRVDWYQSASATAPTVSTFATASNLKASYWPSLKWSMTSAQ